MRKSFRLKKLIYYSGSAVVTGIILTLLFLYVDQPVAWAVYKAHWDSITQISAFIAPLGSTALWVVIMFASLIYGYFRRRPAFLYFGASVFLTFVIGYVLKVVLARYRPPLLFDEGLYGFHFFSTEWLFNSMPSGHALRAFVTATVLSFFYRRYAAIFFLLAALMASSRVFLNVHYLSDVIFGAYIGILSAFLARPILKAKDFSPLHKKT